MSGASPSDRHLPPLGDAFTAWRTLRATLRARRRGAPGTHSAGQDTLQRDQHWQDLAHDLRAHVQSISASASAALDSTALTLQRTALNDIATASAALELQLGSMLDTMYAGAPDEQFDLDSEVARTCQLLQPLARQAGRELLLETSPDACLGVHAQRAALVRVLQNLVGNAVRYADSDSILVQLEHDDQNVLLSVRNAALRLTSDDLNKLGQRAVRGSNAAPGGRGLGLSISRRLAASHGGAAGVAAVAGQFVGWARLPAAPVARHELAVEPGAAHILSANPLVRTVYARQLRSIGMTVTSAADPAPAVQLLSASGQVLRSVPLDQLRELGDPPSLRALCSLLLSVPGDQPAVLLVDDNRLARAHTLRMLSTLGVSDVTAVADVTDAQPLLAGRKFDHIIIDAHLGADSGLELRSSIADRGGLNQASHVHVISAAPDPVRQVSPRPRSSAEIAALLAVPHPADAYPADAFAADTERVAAELAQDIRQLRARWQDLPVGTLAHELHTLAGVAQVWQLTEPAHLLQHAEALLPSAVQAAERALQEAQQQLSRMHPHRSTNGG